MNYDDHQAFLNELKNLTLKYKGAMVSVPMQRHDREGWPAGQPYTQCYYLSDILKATVPVE